tara:strand:- start:2556 stop:3275 length:720 start_codon:yes stop_codon:yes gene_type:complete
LNKKDKKKISILIAGFLVLIFILNQNLFRKFYNIINIDYEDRISKTSGFCSADSAGYLRNLKKKLNLKFNPQVINYEDSVPDSNWAIYDTNLKNNFEYKVLLNYPDELSIKFNRVGNYFYSKNTSKHAVGLLGIIFDLKAESINLNSEIIIYRNKYGSEKKEIIYKNLLNQLILDNEIIKIDFKTKKINNIYKPVILEIKNLNENKIQLINNIKLLLQNEFELKNFEIIDSYQNCYYIK